MTNKQINELLEANTKEELKALKSKYERVEDALEEEYKDSNKKEIDLESKTRSLLDWWKAIVYVSFYACFSCLIVKAIFPDMCYKALVCYLSFAVFFVVASIPLLVCAIKLCKRTDKSMKILKKQTDNNRHLALILDKTLKINNISIAEHAIRNACSMVSDGYSGADVREFLKDVPDIIES